MNPNLDLRYVLPDLLAEKSGNLLQDDGYDYCEKSNAMLVYLTTEDLEKALPTIFAVIENDKVMGNCLKDAAIIAIGEYDNYTVVYPKNEQQPFDAE